MAQIELLQPTEKIKDSYGKINTSLTNLNNNKLEKSGDTMTGLLTALGGIDLDAEDVPTAKVGRIFANGATGDLIYHDLTGWKEVWHDGNNIFALNSFGGYLILSNGLIFQWGAPILVDGGSAVFPIAFPQEVLIILPIAKTNAKVWTENETASGFTLRHDQGANPVSINYLAIGW